MTNRSGASQVSPAVQILGYLLGTLWFAFLAFSGDERPTWLRAVYGVTAIVFAAGGGATAIARMRGHASSGARKSS